MSIKNFADIKVGDRVKLTKGDDVAEFTVADKSDSWIATSAEAEFWADEWDAVEVVHPPIPTTPGFYRGAAWTDGTPALGYHLSDAREWRIIWSNGTSDKRDAPTPADLPLVRLVREGAAK